VRGYRLKTPQTGLRLLRVNTTQTKEKEKKQVATCILRNRQKIKWPNEGRKNQYSL